MLGNPTKLRVKIGSQAGGKGGARGNSTSSLLAYLEDSRAQNYYGEAGKAESMAMGGGWADLGLQSGEQPTREQLENLLQGKGLHGLDINAGNPKERARDVRVNERGEFFAGYDLTFSAPKSVSIIWGLAEHEMKDKIHGAHVDAVMATIKYLEDQGYITLGKGLNGTDKEAARKLLIQTYFHTTSREEDVLLHAHAMLLNLAKLQGDDAAFRRIQGIELFRHKIELGAVYRGELSSNLVELGFSIERDGKSFKVVGVPPELVAASSKGAAKIKAQVEEWGGADTSKARQAAAMKVRAKEKPHSSFEQCAERWAAEGEEHGFTRASIAEIVTDSPAYGKHTVNAAAVISAKTSSGD